MASKGWKILSISLGLLLLLSTFLLGVNIERGQHVGKISYTIGLKTAEASTTADYVCLGAADNVPFQAALNALPASGGQLFVLAGNYNFSATVTRAINNVIIQGVGGSVSFVFNGVDPIFTVGGTGWVFRDFTTDAGGIVGNATLQNVTLGATYYAFSSVAGTLSFPTIIDTGLTAGRVTYAGASKQLTDNANLTWDAATNTFKTSTVNATTVNAGTLTTSNNVTSLNVNNLASTNLTAATGRAATYTIAPSNYWNTSQADLVLPLVGPETLFQAAINSQKFGDYGRQDIYIFPGTITFSNNVSIEIPEGTSIRGAGLDDYGTTLVFYGGGFKSPAGVATVTLVNLSNFIIRSDNASTVINGTGWGRSYFSRMRVRGGAIGVLIDGNYFNTFADCEVGNNLTGYKFTGAANGNWIYRGRVEGTPIGGDNSSGQVGVDVVGASQIHIVDTEFDLLWKGVRLGAYADLFYADNLGFDQIAGDGAAFDLGSSSPNKVTILRPHYDGVMPTVIGTVGPAFTYKYASGSSPAFYWGERNFKVVTVSTNLTALDAGVILIESSGNITIGLPQYVADLHFTFVDFYGGGTTIVKAYAGDFVELSYTQLTHLAGEGDSLDLYMYDGSGRWMILGSRGTWTLG